jgi:hypothetical protein
MTLAPPTRLPLVEVGTPRFGQQVRTALIDLERALKGRDWVVIGAAGAPAFANSWVNFGSTWAPAAYRKDAMGFVHLRGLVKSGTVNVAIFVLPVGFRPIGDLMFGVINDTGPGQGVVQQDGTVRQGAGTGLTNTNGFHTLSGITFLAEQ